MTIRNFTYLGRKRIEQRDVAVRIISDRSGRRLCSARASLGAYAFPPQARVYLAASSVLIVRLDLGSVGEPNFDTQHDVSGLSSEKPVFTLIVVDGSTSQILGVANDIHAEDGKQSGPALLPVDGSESLDGTPWLVEYEGSYGMGRDAPILRIDYALCRGSAQNFVTDPLHLALIMPAAVHKVLTKILLIDTHVFDITDNAWRNAWLRAAGQWVPLPEDVCQDDRDEDALEEWIESAVRVFSSKHRLIAHSLRLLQ